MPQRLNLVATKAPCGDVLVFDTNKFGATTPDLTCKPDHRLAGHTEEGYGLCWSHVDEGKLLSGSDDSRVCMWDVAHSPSAVSTFSAHTDVVEVSESGCCVVSCARR
jgi:histone-binding protein RBBP4